MQLGRDDVDFDPCSLLAQEVDRVSELTVVRNLQPEGHAACVAAQAQALPPGLGEEAEGVVLGVAAQEGAAIVLPGDLLGDVEPEHVAVEGRRRIDVIDEELHRADTRDLEGPRQQDAVDVVGRRHGLHVPVPCCRRASAGEGLFDLQVLRDVRLGRYRRHRLGPHVERLGVPVPADLLDTVVQLHGLIVGIIEVEMIVRPRAASTCAAFPADVDVPVPQVLGGVHHLTPALHLPGDLVDGVLGAEVTRPGLEGEELLVRSLLRAHQDRMMITPVAAEEAAVRPRVADAEAEQVPIEAGAGLQVHQIEAEVAQAAHLERLVEQHATYVERLRRGHRHRRLPPALRSVRSSGKHCARFCCCQFAGEPAIRRNVCSSGV